MSLDNHYYNLESDSKIKIKYKFSTVFHFTSEPEILFFAFLSNICGLLGLWFGLSFIDISLVIKSILVYINIQSHIQILINKVKLLINRLYISGFVIIFLELTKKIFSKVQSLNWKLFITLLTLPIILIQLIHLFGIYFQFSTQIDFDLISYRGIDKRIPINLSPALMICFKFLYDKILFQRNNLDYIAMMRDNFSMSDILNYNNENQSNIEIVREIILKSINESMRIFNYNFTIEQYAYDHVHSMINFENLHEYENNFELTHNKNISGFEHIYKDFLIFKSFTKYSDYSFGRIRV